eukprot:scaffold7097_cov60-Phaeocystis_antarctica.AAC.6
MKSSSSGVASSPKSARRRLEASSSALVAPVAGPLPRGREVCVVDEGVAVGGECHVHRKGRVPQRHGVIVATCTCTTFRGARVVLLEERALLLHQVARRHVVDRAPQLARREASVARDVLQLAQRAARGKAALAVLKVNRISRRLADAAAGRLLVTRGARLGALGEALGAHPRRPLVGQCCTRGVGRAR